MIMQRDMEHSRVLMETDTLGNGVMITETGMEYKDGLKGQYITESSKMVNLMVKDKRGGQVVRNTGESSRIT